MLLKREIKICEYMFELGYFFFLAYSLLVNINLLQNIVKFFGVLAIIFFCFCFLSQIRSYSNNEFIFLFFLLCFSFLFSLLNSYLIFFKTVLILIASKCLNIKRLIKFDFIIRLCLILLVFILYALGFAEDVTFLRVGGVIRHSFGFTGPNALASTIMILLFDLLYINDFKFKPSIIIIVLSIAMVINYYTRSRTPYVVIIFASCLSLIYTLDSKLFYKKAIKFFLEYSFVILSIITYIIFIYYTKDALWAQSLNDVFNKRFERIDFFNNIFKIKFLGNNLALTEKALDNTYAFLLFGQGILLFVVYLIGSVILIKRLYKIRDIPLALLMVCFFLFGLSEMTWLNADYNIFIIAYSYVLFPKKQ